MSLKHYYRHLLSNFNDKRLSDCTERIYVTYNNIYHIRLLVDDLYIHTYK